MKHSPNRTSKHLNAAFILCAVLGLFAAATAFALDAKLVERLDLSTRAFGDLMHSADSSVPEAMLKKCEAIVIFPRTLNVAWGIGGQYGKGVAVRRNPGTGEWSAPAFYMIGGITLGPQIGGQAVDIVLVVMNQKGLDSLLKSKCTLGGDAGVALGPVGRNATASTDLGLKAEIYSYSRAKGLYVGLSLKGALVKPDNSANAEYYGRALTAREILVENQGAHQSYDKGLMRELGRFAGPRSGWVWLLVALVIVASFAVFFAWGRLKS